MFTGLNVGAANWQREALGSGLFFLPVVLWANYRASEPQLFDSEPESVSDHLP